MERIEMEYTRQTYEKYDSYILERRVRDVHDSIFKLLSYTFALQSVIDLGCGCSKEFLKHFKPSHYVSVDSNIETNANIIVNFRVDPLRLVRVAHEIANYPITGFVSLFASEIHGPPKDNYDFYTELFKHDSIQVGLVSGFYYKGKRDCKTVRELIGPVYQTVDNIEDIEHPAFSETRITVPCPSELFGEDVIEVWKLFVRTPDNE